MTDAEKRAILLSVVGSGGSRTFHLRGPYDCNGSIIATDIIIYEKLKRILGGP